MKPPSSTKTKAVSPVIWRILQKFWPQICKRRFLLAGSFLALLTETGFRLLQPWPLKFIFDNVLIPQAGVNSSITIETYGINPLLLLGLLCLAIVLIAALEGTAAYLSTFGMALAATQILA